VNGPILSSTANFLHSYLRYPPNRSSPRRPTIPHEESADRIVPRNILERKRKAFLNATRLSTPGPCEQVTVSDRQHVSRASRHR